MLIDEPFSRPLTERQEEILAFIRSQVQANGMPPTHDEIKDELGLQSAYGVRQHLRLISAKGYIELLPGKSRGIRMLSSETEENKPRLTMIPLVGRIAAGEPILAQQNIEGQIAIDEELFPPGVLFALRVIGSSMIKIGIKEGDLAVIRQQVAVENGQVAAVLEGEEATLKRVFVRKDHILIVAENDDVPDRRIRNRAGDNVSIQGLYVGLIRQARRQ